MTPRSMDKTASRVSAERLWLVTAGPDGEVSQIAVGFDAMTDAVVRCIWEDPSGEEGADQMREEMADPDFWSGDFWSCQWAFEDGYLQVQRITDASALRSLSDSVSDGSKGVRVKPLEWGVRRVIDGVNWAWDAKTSIDWYVVATASGEGCKGSHYWFVAGDTIKGWANSEDEAKAAAQADYEQRILSALDLEGGK